MKKLLLKELSAFIVTAMLFSASSNAQIVYTDVNPDTVFTCTLSLGNPCSTMYQLDLNNDGIVDFQLVKFYGTAPRQNSDSYVSVTPLGSNKFTSSTTNFGTFNLVCASALANGDSIQNNNWYGARLMLEQNLVNGLSFAFTCHHWNAVTDKYLGLKLIVGSNTYYGWVRLDVAQNGTSFTVKDYAYNNIPNQPILAGETIATGINENSFASSIQLFPNPASDHLTINLGTYYKEVQVTITDLSGKIIYTSLATDNQKIEVNTQGFAEGIYVVQIQSAGFVGTKKLVIEK